MFAAVHRAADRRFAPWKNGGGETAEILCHPQGAGYDGFGWRISTARVASDGPFSRFDGVMRSLTVIDGGPLRLVLGDGRDVVLDRAAPPFAFDGALACDGLLTGDAVLDLNVMVRKPYRCDVRRGDAPVGLSGPQAARFLFACADLPQIGLRRHDLAHMSDGADWPRADASCVYFAICA